MPRSARPSFVRDSVFRLGAKPQVCEKIPEPFTPTRRHGVSLTDDEIDWLDCRCCEVRRNGWRAVSRSALIRAILETVRARPLALAGACGEAELVDKVKRALGPEHSAIPSEDGPTRITPY